MSWTDAFAPVETANRQTVLADTWGHLAPVRNKSYLGRLVFAFGVYDSGELNPTILVCEFGSDDDVLDGGPWFYDAVHAFLGQYTPGEPGRIYEWTGTFRNYRFAGRRRRLFPRTHPSRQSAHREASCPGKSRTERPTRRRKGEVDVCE